MKPDPQWGPAKKEHRTGMYAVDVEMDSIDVSDFKNATRLEGLDNPAASTTSVNMVDSGGDTGNSNSYKF